MKTENLKEAPTNQWASSIFWLIPLALVFGIALIVATFALINWALPSDDAKMLKNLFGLTIGGSTGGAALSGAIGFVQRSLRLTEAKLQSFHLDDEDARQIAAAALGETVLGKADEFDPMNTRYDHLLGADSPGGSPGGSPAASALDLVFQDMVPRGRVKDSE